MSLAKIFPNRFNFYATFLIVRPFSIKGQDLVAENDLYKITHIAGLHINLSMYLSAGKNKKQDNNPARRRTNNINSLMNEKVKQQKRKMALWCNK